MLQQDAQMDAYRLEALKAILPKGTPANKLGPSACEITMLPLDGTNEVVKRKTIVTTCMEKELEAKGFDTPGLDIKAMQAKCLKCAFPKLSEADAVAQYKGVVKSFESYEENALRVNSEWVHARQTMIRECALEAEKKLPANLKGDLQFLYALHLNSTALEIPVAAGGAVDVYCTTNGKAPSKCPQCASEAYTTVDAAKVEATRIYNLGMGNCDAACHLTFSHRNKKKHTFYKTSKRLPYNETS
ncbi:hypothetical protein HPB50_009974 [Hyalomma asiaticum]|uniref:Uncharacterized protein n=1 Tax=Hyalomma asiaticum TaxID=266040 RepID=A0ACB7RZ09_HYAAI|nr:hypothetical protein HPB50_009974 [Hyalomma asiaticum]